MMSHALTNASSTDRLRRLERLGGQREVANPIDLEGPRRIARLVEPEQVERVRDQRRLDVPRVNARRSRLLGRIVDRGVVREGHDPTLGPGLRQQLHVAGERRIRPRRDITSSVRVTCSASTRRQVLRELLERRPEVGVVLVGIADHQPGRQEDRHRLGARQLERRQKPLALDAPDAALAPDGDAELLARAREDRGRPSASTSRPGGRSRRSGHPARRDPRAPAARDRTARGGRACRRGRRRDRLGSVGSAPRPRPRRSLDRLADRHGPAAVGGGQPRDEIRLEPVPTEA